MNQELIKMADLLTKVRPALAVATWFEDTELAHAVDGGTLYAPGYREEKGIRRCLIGDGNGLHFIIASITYESGAKAAEGFVRRDSDAAIIPLPTELAEECVAAAEAFFTKGGTS